MADLQEVGNRWHALSKRIEQMVEQAFAMLSESDLSESERQKVVLAVKVITDLLGKIVETAKPLAQNTDLIDQLSASADRLSEELQTISDLFLRFPTEKK